jgi:tetratricopeptide (TPR) repeat protein
MKRFRKPLAFLAMMATVFVPYLCFGQITPGDMAPAFSVKDVKGTTYDLNEMRERSMIIVYFFDAQSRPSQEGLLSLDQLAKRYADADLIVWGVTLSSREAVSAFLTNTKLGLPILLDDTGISDQYQARFIVPTVCVIGPGLLVMDYFQGGGKTIEIMLTRLAERTLQRRQTVLAKAISDEVEKKNPRNIKAKTVKGYAALKEGNLDEAEKTFQALSKKSGEAEVLGKEGLSAVYAKKGKTAEALEMAAQVEQKAPNRAFVHVVRGDILYSQNRKDEAEKEYQQGVEKTLAAPFQKATAFNQLGRLNASLGNYEQARELYDQAVEIDPYNIEATSNKGMTYEKEGRWNDALGAYRKALSLDKEDTFAAVLARKAEEMLAIQQDATKKQRIDKLVKDLAARYRSQEKTKSKAQDSWTSRPMVLSFVDFQEKGGLSPRDGFSSVLTTQLSDQLNASGRVRAVERVVVERLLEELNIGSSELADPDTALKLGKIFAAKIIGTGTLFVLPDGTIFNMRLIDTETSAISKVVTKHFSSDAPLDKEIGKLHREILRSIIETYPLQGYVVQVSAGQEVMINLGAKQGVVLGTKFDVIEDQAPVKYKGKLLRSAPKTIGQIEIVRVEPDLSYARIIEQERDLKTDDKVKEKIVDLIALGAYHAVQ